LLRVQEAPGSIPGDPLFCIHYLLDMTWSVFGVASKKVRVDASIATLCKTDIA